MAHTVLLQCPSHRCPYTASSARLRAREKARLWAREIPAVSGSQEFVEAIARVAVAYGTDDIERCFIGLTVRGWLRRMPRMHGCVSAWMRGWGRWGGVSGCG